MQGQKLHKRHFEIREFTESDIPELLRLMKALARFEGYIHDFAVTDSEIRRRGLSNNPEFRALVAQISGSDKLCGMAVTYTIPYTYSLKPDMVLKELYVDAGARGFGIGRALFGAAKVSAQQAGCEQMIWTVLSGNLPAESFYRGCGGSRDHKWMRWTCPVGSSCD